MIAIYFGDHNPPHFHASYGEHEALIVISTLEVLKGGLPSKQARRVAEWAQENKGLLQSKWDECNE